LPPIQKRTNIYLLKELIWLEKLYPQDRQIPKA